MGMESLKESLTLENVSLNNKTTNINSENIENLEEIDFVCDVYEISEDDVELDNECHYSFSEQQIIKSKHRKLRRNHNFIVDEKNYGNSLFAKFGEKSAIGYHFYTLLPRQWLKLELIEFFISILISKSSYKDSIKLFSGTEIQKLFYPSKNIKSTCNFVTNQPHIILPIYTGNHFYLVIISNNKFYYFDSLGKVNFDKAQDHFKTWKLATNDETSNLTLYVPQHPKQKDTFNCGVYVLYYVSRFLESLDRPLSNDFCDFNFNFRFNANKHRIEIMNLLILQSQFVYIVQIL